VWFSFLLRRVLSAIPTLVGVLTLVFLFVRLVPGDPAQAILGEYATPANVEAMRESLGLNAPLHEQYLSFMGKALQLDFGRSFQTRQAVSERIMDALPFTLNLGLAALAVALVIGIPAGVIAALKRNTPVDYSVTVAALLGISMPNFWFGMLLIILFSVTLQWFPITGAGVAGNPLQSLYYLILPSIALGASEGGVIMRMTRSTMLETLGQDYVRTARAKGLPNLKVVLRHALRNSLIPVVTIVGLNLGRLIGGTVIIESLFVRPGIGRVMVDAMVARDYPQVQGTVAFFAILIVTINLLVDLSYGILDPRIKYA
jgi:ABC-type dipeptide/oligopeptide/nickel transport system permease component